jgi:peptidase S24-like protein
MDRNTKIGERIKNRRISLEYTQQQVADMVGVHKSTIQRYETGKVDDLKMPVIQAIANALRVNPDWLTLKTDKMEAKLYNNTLTYVIGENGEREVRYSDGSDSKNRDALLEEMGIKKNKNNYIMSKENVKTELSDNEYEFLINSLGFYRKK